MSKKQKLKSKGLSFILSFILLFQSLGIVSFIKANAVEVTQEYSVNIFDSINNQVGNKVPIIAEITKNNTGTNSTTNPEFAIKLFKGTELVGKVSQGEENFRLLDLGTKIMILAYYDEIITAEYKIVVEVKTDVGVWEEIGSTILNIQQRKPIIYPNYINVNSSDFRINLNGFGGNLLHGLTPSDISVELWNAENIVVASSSYIVDGAEALNFDTVGFPIEPFSEKSYHASLNANLHKIFKMVPGNYKIVVKVKGQVAIKNGFNIEAIDKTFIKSLQYDNDIEKFIAPGAREFDVNVDFLGDTNKSSINIELYDLNNNLIAKSVSSDYKWYSQEMKEGRIVYRLNVLDGKAIEANKQYKFKVIGSNLLINESEYYFNSFMPSTYIKAINIDYSKIKAGILKVKLANYDTNKEYKAELYNNENGNWNPSEKLSTSFAKPSSDGSTIFMFKDASGNLMNIPYNKLGLILKWPRPEDGNYQDFYFGSIYAPNIMNDEIKEIYDKSVDVISPVTKNFSTSVTLKNISPDINSTYVNLLDSNNQVVGAMDKSTMRINYSGSQNGNELYRVDGIININSNLQANVQYKYEIICNNEKLITNEKSYIRTTEERVIKNYNFDGELFKNNTYYLTNNTSELDLKINGALNIIDINKLDIQLLNGGKNYVTLDRSSAILNKIGDNLYDISLKLPVSESLIEGQYTLVFKYDNQELFNRNYTVSSLPLYRSFYFGNSTSIQENKLSLSYYDTLNLDPNKMIVSLTDFNGNSIPLTVVADSIKSIYKNLYFDVIPSTPLNIGKYVVNVKQGNKDLTEVDPNQYKGNVITVTEKPVITNVNQYRTPDNKTNYVMESSEFNTVSNYKAILYKNGTNINNRALAKELPLMVTENGKLVISEDQLQGLEQGVYETYIEKDNIILTRVYIFYSPTTPGENNTPKAGTFLINHGASYTNSKTVNLTINSTGYSEFKVANSETELEAATYEAIVGVKTWNLSEGEGEKIVYLQFKDETGMESEVIQKRIFCDTIAPAKPEILSPSIGQAVQVNSYFGVKAAGLENINLYAEVCKSEGENITVLKTIKLYTTGIENGKNVFYRTINADASIEGGNLLRAYAEDYAGNKSEVAQQEITVVKYGSIKGILTKLDKPSVYTSIVVKKKNGDNYESFRWIATNEKGEYSISNLEPGDYQLYVYGANGFNEIVENVTINSGDIVDKNLAFVDKYEGNRGSIKIIAKDNAGNPVSGVQVGLSNWSLQQYNYRNTDANGEALFENIPVHEGYSYYFYYDGVSKYKDNISIVKGETKEENVVVPLMKPISGKVRDKDNNPISNVEIRIEGKDLSGNTTYNWGRTNENGEYSVKVEDDKTYTIVVNTINNTLFNYYAEEKKENIAAGAENVDIIVYKGLSIYGRITDSNGVGLSGLNVYATDRENWSSFRVVTNSNGEYRFGSVLGIGAYEISTWKPGFTEDSGNVKEINISSLSNPSSTITYSDGSEATVATEAAIALKDIKINQYDMNGAFNGVGNRVTTDTSLTQRGKDITVKITYQNNSPNTINNVNIKANVPEGISLVTGSGLLEKNVDSISPGATGEMIFMLRVGENFAADNFTVSAEASFGDKKSSIGYANVEIVNATINGPSKDSDGTFKLYGEATIGSTITIMDKVTGRIFAVTKPIGKWYSVDIKNIDDGNYEFIAQAEKDGKTSTSNILKLEVMENVFEIENANFKTSSGQSIGINEETGIPAFSVWVDTQLKGRDITAYTKLTKALEEGYTVSYEFLGKSYAATLENGQWTAVIKDWSGSGIEKIYLVIKDANGNQVYKFTVAELIILIDPSGYVYDVATGERIKGATAICEIKDSNGNWVKWDAEKYGQVNPQITDEEGKYGWMVPAGEYRVRVQLEGYKDYVTTDDASIDPIIIPPPRTDVNIGLEKIVNFEVSKVTVSKDQIKVNLTKAVNAATINNSSVKVFDSNGNEISGTVLSNNSEITFTPNSELQDGIYSITLKDTVKDTEGISLSMYTSGFVITSGEAKLDIIEVVVDSFNLGTTGKVALSATNYMAEDKEVTLIVALYDKNTNKMIKYSSDYKTLASGDSINLEASIEMPESGEYKVKYFVWDTLKDMNPYMEAKTVK